MYVLAERCCTSCTLHVLVPGTLWHGSWCQFTAGKASGKRKLFCLYICVVDAIRCCPSHSLLQHDGSRAVLSSRMLALVVMVFWRLYTDCTMGLVPQATCNGLAMQKAAARNSCCQPCFLCMTVLQVFFQLLQLPPIQ